MQKIISPNEITNATVCKIIKFGKAPLYRIGTKTYQGGRKQTDAIIKANPEIFSLTFEEKYMYYFREEMLGTEDIQEILDQFKNHIVEVQQLGYGITQYIPMGKESTTHAKASPMLQKIKIYQGYCWIKHGDKPIFRTEEVDKEIEQTEVELIDSGLDLTGKPMKEISDEELRRRGYEIPDEDNLNDPNNFKGERIKEDLSPDDLWGEKTH